VDEDFFGQADAARTYLELARRCQVLFVAAGVAMRADTDPERKPLLATASRHLGDHAGAWEDLVPESVLLADARDAVEALPALPASPEVVVGALRTLSDDLGALLARTSPVADAPARRLARIVLADLAPLVAPPAGA
jgi:hypothetical protein